MGVWVLMGATSDIEMVAAPKWLRLAIDLSSCMGLLLICDNVTCLQTVEFNEQYVTFLVLSQND